MQLLEKQKDRNIYDQVNTEQEEVNGKLDFSVGLRQVWRDLGSFDWISASFRSS